MNITLTSKGIFFSTKDQKGNIGNRCLLSECTNKNVKKEHDKTEVISKYLQLFFSVLISMPLELF